MAAARTPRSTSRSPPSTTNPQRLTIRRRPRRTPPPPLRSWRTTRTPLSTIAVLATDTYPLGDPVAVRSVGAPAHGGAAINPDGTISYTPGLNYNGPDSLSYTIGDGHGGTASATVTVTVTAANDAP